MLGSLKRFTAKECNNILGRSGDFWQHESYDHVIRNHEELLKIVRYVLYNPVKAGLVEDYNNYDWNYYNPKFL